MSIAIALRGKNHEQNGLPCQDVCVGERQQRKAWLALADGAGSCAHSQEGAKTCVQTLRAVLWRFRGGWHGEAAESVLVQLHDALNVVTEKRQCTLTDLSSTLLAAQVFGNRYIALHIGDGVLGVFHANGSLSVLSPPENGAFSNQTFFVTSPDAAQHLRLYSGELGDIEGFVTMSDGAAEALYAPREQTFTPLVKMLFERLRCFGGEATLQWFAPIFEAYVRANTADDVSLAATLCPAVKHTHPSQLSPETLRTVVGMETDPALCPAMQKVLKRLEGGEAYTGKSLLRNLHLPNLKSEIRPRFWVPLMTAGLIESAGGGCYRLAPAFLPDSEQRHD